MLYSSAFNLDFLSINFIFLAFLTVIYQYFIYTPSISFLSMFTKGFLLDQQLLIFLCCSPHISDLIENKPYFNFYHSVFSHAFCSRHMLAVILTLKCKQINTFHEIYDGSINWQLFRSSFIFILSYNHHNDAIHHIYGKHRLPIKPILHKYNA